MEEVNKKVSQETKNLSAQSISGSKETCGDRLAKLLDILGITKTDLAKESDVVLTTVSRYCESDSLPGTKVMATLVKKYRVRVEWLMGAGGPIFSSDSDDLGVREPAAIDYQQECLRLQHELAAKDRENASKDRAIAATELAMGRQQGQIFEAVRITCRQLGMSDDHTRIVQMAVMDYENVLAECGAGGAPPPRLAAGE